MTKEKVFGHTHKKNYFNNKEEIDKKKWLNILRRIFLCMCVQTLLIWSCDHGRIHMCVNSPISDKSVYLEFRVQLELSHS